jgi:5-methylcytosine-specific restriction protein A
MIGEGFVHVHHVTPVSEIGPGYVVNPATDLVPLCPNCHAMAHRSSPPLAVEALKKLLANPMAPFPRE